MYKRDIHTFIGGLSTVDDSFTLRFEGRWLYTHDNRTNDGGSPRKILDMVVIEIQQTSIYEGGEVVNTIYITTCGGEWECINIYR